MTPGQLAPTEQPRERGFRWLIATIALWLVAPFVLILVLTLVAQQQSVYGPDEPVWVAAEDAGAVSARQIELALTWGESATVFAPSWAGTVREVLVQGGTTVKSGDAVVRVDGILRIAWHSASPFYRPLSQGDRGDDVVALNRLLKARSLPASDGDLFTSTTRRGVALFAQQIGAGTGITVFDPSLVLYLPTDELPLAEVHLTVGTVAPATGEPVLVAQPPLDRGVLVGAGSEEQGVASPISAEPGELLMVGDSIVELAEGRAEVASSSLVTLGKGLSAGQERLAAVLRRDLPEGSVRVPAAAIHTDQDGVTCVAIRKSDTESRIKVAVIGGLAGQAVVTGAVTEGDMVGVGAIEATARCSS